MKKTWKWAFLLVLIVAMGTFFCACDETNPLVGTWSMRPYIGGTLVSDEYVLEESLLTLELNSDGRFSLYAAESIEEERTGVYTIEGNQLIMTVTYPEGDVETLEIVEKDGDVFLFTEMYFYCFVRDK